MKDKKETKQTYKPDKDSKKWKDRFEFQERRLRSLHESARKRFDVLYATQTIKGMSPWKSKVYVPVLASKAWDLIARMSDVVPLFNVTVKGSLDMDETGAFKKDPMMEQVEERVQAKLHADYIDAEGEPMKFKVFNPLVDAIVPGTGFAYAAWKTSKKVIRSRKQLSNGSLSNDGVIKKTVTQGKNEFSGLNFFNVFPSDDSNGSWQDQSYIIVRGFMPKYMAKKKGWKNLDKAATGTPDNTFFKLNNEARNRVVNEESDIYTDDTVDTITYYECYERDTNGIKRCIYMEGEPKDGVSTWIEAVLPDYPYWHDLYPIVPFYSRRKSFTVFGESLFENNQTLQSAVNDLFNHYLDNWNLSIDSMIMIEDGSLTNDFVVRPGGEIRYTGEKPTQYKFPEPNPTQLSVVMSVLEKGIENATFSQYASGVPNSATDKTQGTAYGIKSITEAATTKIGFFRDNFKQSMKIVGTIWASNLKQFENTPQEVYRDVNGRQQPDIVMPVDYQPEMVIDIDDDSMVPLSKQEKLERHERFVNSLIAQQKAAYEQYALFKVPTDVPRINWLEVTDDTATFSSVKDTSRYLLPSDIEIPQPAPTEPSPEEKILDNISKKYDKAAPDIKAELESMAGLQPSAIHDSSLTHEAIMMGAEQAKMEKELIGEQNGETEGRTPGETKQGATGE